MARSDRVNLAEQGGEEAGLSKTKRIVISTVATVIVVAAVVAIVLTVASKPNNQSKLQNSY